MFAYLNFFAASVLLLISTNSIADDMFDILKRMSEADKKQNYQGTFILRKSDKLSTLHVTHGVDEKGDWENLQSLSGESKNVYRRNKQVVSVYPEREIITIRYTDEERSLHPQLPRNLDQLELFYSMNRLADDRIADHQAFVVDLLPIDQYRYGYRYWVDKKTGMLLRCDLFDKEKNVIEQMMFTSLEYLSSPPVETFDLQQFDRFQQQNIGAHEVALHTGEKSHWVVNRLPKGFMLTQSILRQSQPESRPHQQIEATSQAGSEEGAIDSGATQVVDKNLDLLHLVYSDGLASVSVFIEKDKGVSSHLYGASSMGAVNAFGNLVGEHFVTVVGEVPAKTVQLMAQSTSRIH